MQLQTLFNTSAQSHIIRGVSLPAVDANETTQENDDDSHAEEAEGDVALGEGVGWVGHDLTF